MTSKMTNVQVPPKGQKASDPTDQGGIKQQLRLLIGRKQSCQVGPELLRERHVAKSTPTTHGGAERFVGRRVAGMTPSSCDQ